MLDLNNSNFLNFHDRVNLYYGFSYIDYQDDFISKQIRYDLKKDINILTPFTAL